MRFEDEYDSWCLKDILVDDILHYCRFICAAHDKSYYFRKLILTKNNTIIFPRTQVSLEKTTRLAHRQYCQLIILLGATIISTT